MEWSDILVKIGVGACLGFGIIVLAKLTKKKNQHDKKSSSPNSALSQDTATRGDTRRDDH